MTIALVELADFATSDVAKYARCNGVRLPVIRRVRVDGGTTIAASGENIEEATADIEVVLGMAPGARILVYEAPSAQGLVSLLAAYAAIVSQDKAQVASVSYDECEGHLLSTERTAAYAEQGLFAAMAIQGQSMLAAAGDSGSESCLASFPLSSVTSLAGGSRTITAAATGTSAPKSCYRATKGYDMATGLGTPNAARLASDFRRSS
jgi:subtilase family serine protease